MKMGTREDAKRRTRRRARGGGKMMKSLKRRAGPAYIGKYQECIIMLFDMFNDEELTRASNILEIKGYDDNEKLLKRIRNPAKDKKGRDHVVKECKKKLRELRGIFVHLISAITVGWLWAIIKKTFRSLKEATKLMWKRLFLRRGFIKKFITLYHVIKILLKFADRKPTDE